MVIMQNRHITGLYMLRRRWRLGFRVARSFRYAPFPHHTPPTFLQALETYGFLYRACKNVIYSRNVMRNAGEFVGYV
jgi:hypothetical protein